MPSLEIYNSTATSYSGFVDSLEGFITRDNFMTSIGGPSAGNIRDVSGASLKLPSTSYRDKYLKFNNFCNNETGNSNGCLFLTASSYTGFSLNCVPVMYLGGGSHAAFYSDANKRYTKSSFTDSNSSVFSNFRAVKYSDTKTQFLSLGRPSESMTISTHVFKSIDDPTITKTVFVVTDYDGYVSFYDSYAPYPWHVENTYHNGNNIGHTSSINAYKLAIKGYYCDNLYYFDGAYSMPGEGVSTIGGIKFLKLGDSNLFIKME